ncbi:hypothetical protein HDU83_008239, partial [Entophlyctis luteolus]
MATATNSVLDGDRDRDSGGSSGSGQMAMLELVQCNITVVVRYDYDATDPTKLSLRRGEMVLVQQKAPTGWWHGAIGERRGWFPSNFVAAMGEGGIFDALTNLGLGSAAAITTGNQTNSDVTVSQTASDLVELFLILRKFLNSILEQADATPVSLHSTHIQCVTDDGRTYYVHKVTGETLWENELTGDVVFTDHHNQYNQYANGPNSAMLSNSLNSAYDTRSISSSGRSRLNYDATSNSSSALPPGWSKIDSIDGQTMYFNSATREMQFSPPEADDFAYSKLLMPPQQLIREADDWPPNWSQKTLADGRVFFFNFMSDECAWELNEVNANGDLVIGTLFTIIKHITFQITPVPEITDEISSAIRRLAEVTIPSGYASWRKLIETVQLYAQKVNSAIIDRDRIKVFHYYNTLVAAIRALLVSARSVDGPSEQKRKVRSLTSRAGSVIKKAMHSSSVACMIWSPPNSMQHLQTDTAELIASISELVAAAVDSALTVPPEELLESKATFVASTDKTISNVEILLEMKQRCLIIKNMVADFVKDVLGKVYQDKETELLEGMRAVTAKMGDISGVLDEHLPPLFLSVETSSELREKKQHFFNTVSQVMSAISIAANAFAPASAAIDVATSAKECYTSSTELIICVKFAIQEKEIFEDVGYSLAGDESSSIHSGSRSGTADTDATKSPDLTLISNYPKRHSSLFNSVPLGRKSKNEDVRADHDSGSAKSRKFSSYEQKLEVGISEFQSMLGSPTTPKLKSPETPSIPRLNIPKPKEKKNDVATSSALVSSSRPEKPWYLRYEPPETEIVFNTDGAVKGGTLKALVERLTLHDSNDPSFVQSFLLTYRSFATTYELLMNLQDRYLIMPPEGLNSVELVDWNKHCRDLVRLRVFNVMKSWVENYCYDDDDDDRRVLKLMKAFADTIMMEETPTTAFQLSNLVDRREEYGVHMRVRTTQYNSAEFPQPIWPWNPKRITLLDLNPLEAARQLTLMESAMYNRINPVECLKKAWSNKADATAALNVKGMIKMSNQIAGWVCATILTEPDIKKRALNLKHFIAIAEKCRALNNFCTLNTILGALNSASIHRLKKTWLQVGKRIVVFKELCELMSLDKNFARYRETIQSSNPPCLPYFGLCLTDLTFIEDGSADVLKAREKVSFPGQFQEDSADSSEPEPDSSPLINFYKHIKTAEIIRSIQQFQNEPYHLAPVREIQEFFYASFDSDIDDRELFALSLELEPRDRDNDRMARAIMESGFLEKGLVGMSLGNGNGL